MLLLFLSLVLGTPQGQGKFQTANLGEMMFVLVQYNTI